MSLPWVGTASLSRRPLALTIPLHGPASFVSYFWVLVNVQVTNAGSGKDLDNTHTRAWGRNVSDILPGTPVTRLGSMITLKSSCNPCSLVVTREVA